LGRASPGRSPTGSFPQVGQRHARSLSEWCATGPSPRGLVAFPSMFGCTPAGGRCRPHVRVDAQAPAQPIREPDRAVAAGGPRGRDRSGAGAARSRKRLRARGAHRARVDSVQPAQGLLPRPRDGSADRDRGAARRLRMDAGATARRGICAGPAAAPLFAGLVLLSTRPFRVGERVAWSEGLSPAASRGSSAPSASSTPLS
jgi:hypothetical protein